MAKQAAATTEVDVTDLLEAIGQLNAKLEDALNRVETLAESSAGIRNTVFNVNERLVAVESNVSATEAAGAGIPSEAYSGITVPQVFLLMLQTAVRAQIERHASSFGGVAGVANRVRQELLNSAIDIAFDATKLVAAKLPAISKL